MNTQNITKGNHDQVREKVSEAYRDFNKIKKSTNFISNKFSEFSKVNRTLATILKLVIFGDSVIFLLFVLFMTYWQNH